VNNISVDDAIHCLVVGNDAKVTGLIVTALTASDYEIDVCPGAAELVASLTQSAPDILVVDDKLLKNTPISLSDVIDITTNTPVLVITPSDNGVSRISALESGADDTVDHDVSQRELRLRVDSLMRRQPAERRSRAMFLEGMELDKRQRTLAVDGQQVELTPIEFSLLQLFLRHRGSILSRSVIASVLWGSADPTYHHNLDVHVSNLRRKLRSLPEGGRLHISGVRGVGFKVEAG